MAAGRAGSTAEGKSRRALVPSSLIPPSPCSLARPLSGSPGLCRLNGGRSRARVSQRVSCTPRSPHRAVTASKLPPGGRQRPLLRRFPGGLRPQAGSVLAPATPPASPTRPPIHTVAHTFAGSLGSPAPLSLPPGARRLDSGSLAARVASSARNLRAAAPGPPSHPALELGGRANVPRPTADGSPYRRDAALQCPSSYSLTPPPSTSLFLGDSKRKLGF